MNMVSTVLALVMFFTSIYAAFAGEKIEGLLFLIAGWQMLIWGELNK